jgi:hypothetical protein
MQNIVAHQDAGDQTGVEKQLARALLLEPAGRVECRDQVQSESRLVPRIIRVVSGIRVCMLPFSTPECVFPCLMLEGRGLCSYDEVVEDVGMEMLAKIQKARRAL